MPIERQLAEVATELRNVVRLVQEEAAQRRADHDRLILLEQRAGRLAQDLEALREELHQEGLRRRLTRKEVALVTFQVALGAFAGALVARLF